jgi:hypothetical protein
VTCNEEKEIRIPISDPRPTTSGAGGGRGIGRRCERHRLARALAPDFKSIVRRPTSSSPLPTAHTAEVSRRSNPWLRAISLPPSPHRHCRRTPQGAPLLLLFSPMLPVSLVSTSSDSAARFDAAGASAAGGLPTPSGGRPLLRPCGPASAVPEVTDFASSYIRALLVLVREILFLVRVRAIIRRFYPPHYVRQSIPKFQRLNSAVTCSWT